MKIKSTAAATLITLVFMAGLLGGGSAPASAAGTMYYVSAAGSDTNVGTSPDSPWRSLEKVNGAALQPGDIVSFRRGDKWNGGLVVNQSGAVGLVITLNSYGSGDLPTIVGGQTANCVRLNGSFIAVDGLRAAACGYAGFSVYGDNSSVRNSIAVNNAAGIKVGDGSDFGSYTNNTLADNNIMNVNTPGTGCGTARAVRCSDDSGAFGVLINGNDNEFSGNTVTGSTAASYDFTRDGSAFEIFNGSRNRIHHNVAADNNVFSEIGRSTGTADGNTYSYNLIRSTCGANCSKAAGLIARGSASSFGPTNRTTFEYNTVWLDGPDSQAVVCHASCPASTVIRGNILVGVRNSLWMDSSGWTEQQNVLNGPTNIAPSATSTTASAGFVNAPADLHLTDASPGIDRADSSPFGTDLDGRPVAQNGDCTGTSAADSGTFEYKSPNC
ncbi:hypothetical protein [Pseudarthrobacter sp. S9]|uniref:hypothetical protein n=1 Tax=Pseudarthrobacter sp. S9 TaxID=3418421 RepID=UPI003D08B729